jgi:hypothetical protein
MTLTKKKNIQKEEKGTSIQNTKNGILKQTFIDISLLYRNFFHWNISKLIFFLYGILLAFISILPFALIYYIYTRIYWWTFSTYIISILNSVFLDSAFWNIIHILLIIVFGVSFYFSYILLIKLNNSYLKWEKLPFFKNEYLNFKLFFKYFLLTLLFFLILLIPVVLTIIVLTVIVIILWGTEASISLIISWPINFLTIFSLISLIVLVLVLFYIFYRFVFSYFILVESDTNKKKWILASLKESFIKTRWFKKLLNFIKVFFIIWILWLPFSSIDRHLSETYTDLGYYAKYINLWEQEKETLKSLNSYYYENLELTYPWAWIEEINALEDKYYYFVTFFWIFRFLFINWVILMVFNSFYYHKIKE